MLGRGYTVTMDAVAVTAAQDLIEIVAPSDGVCIIDRVEVSQETQTSSEALAIQLHRSSASGTGTSATPRPIQAGDAAFGGTAEVDHSADTTPSVVLLRSGWNVLAPYIWHPTPEERIIVPPSGVFVVRLESAPGASMTMSAVVSFREIG